MSEPSPKKVGSLRDRIAAFENKGSSPAPPPAPVPRPKPVHVTWQPKSASPPASPKRDTDDGEGKKAAGMSAADAKESIGKLSLKERMAALQGSAAFGGVPAGSPPPRPTGEKTKWKPPPVVQRVQPIGGEDEEKPTDASATTSPSADKEEGARSPTSADVLDEGEAKEEAKEKEEGEPKDTEEERQRRAALAARMARLGGARVGMAPPIFGKKPDIPPKRIPTKDEERPKEEEKLKEEEKPTEDATPKVETKLAEVSPTVQEAAAIELPPSMTEESAVSDSADYFAPPEKESTSTLSPDSATSAPVRSPAMPVPLGPKRAAPPRKRPAKSPSPAQPVIEQVVHESPAPLANKGELDVHDEPEEFTTTDAAPESLAPRGDLEPEVTESQVQYLLEETTASEPVKDEVTDKPASARKSGSQEHEASEPEPEPEVAEQPVGVVPASEEPQDKEAYNVEEPEAHESQHKEELIPEPGTEEQQPEEGVAEPAVSIMDPEEEDEAARRKRIAERLAKSGGFNPFAGGLPPPSRRDSADSAHSPPLPTRRDSHQEIGVKPPPRRDSQQESIQTPFTATSLESEVLERKASVDSVQSGLESPRKTSLDGGVSEEPHVFEQTTRTRELYVEPIAETLEYEDEATETRGEHEAGHDRREGFADDQESERYEESDDQQATRETNHDELETFQEESSVQSFPPPPARQPVPTSPAAYYEIDEDVALFPPPPPRREFPPPPARVVIPPPPRPAEVDVEAERLPSPELDIEEDAYSGHAREVEPKHEIHEDEQRVSRDDDERAGAYLSGHKVNSARVAELDEHRGHQESVLPHPPPRHAVIPPPPPPFTEEEGEAQEDEVPEEDEPAAALPPPLPRRSSAAVPPCPPTHTPTDDVFRLPETADPGDNVGADEPAPPPPPPTRHPRPTSQMPVSVTSNKPILPPLRGPTPEQEILDDSDVDPIDPEFYSPRSPLKSVGSGSLPAISPLSSPPPPPPARLVSPPVTVPPPQRVVSPPSVPERTPSPPSATSPPPPPVSARPHVAPPVPEQQEDQGEVDGDAEQTRRRTIAERMAKLGGIRFGAPPPIPAVRRPAPAPEPEGERDDDEEEQKPAEPEEAPLAEEEEDEAARKQRIAARIAGMGGMRFGMLPGTPAPKPPPRVQREEEEGSVMSPPPPQRSAPVPPPPPHPPAEEDHGEESDYQHVSDSDRAGHEESELEEVTYTDAEEEAPPPVPDRGVRRVSTGPPPIPHTFASPPPVPRTRPPAPPAFTYPPPPHPPPPPATQETQGDFVMVSQAESADEPPPPPPPRATRPPPRAPPRAPPSEPEAVKSQWENHSMPNIDFGGETDLSFSGQWSEDSTSYPPGTAPAASETGPPQPPARSAPMPVEQHLTPDELMAHWGRVGVQVHEISAALFEKSKKSLVGDGSYLGFVNAVLSQVPNAAQPTDSLDSFGYLVYSQSVAAVHRRVSDIMPGDVVVVHDAKFKGHKGLQSYNQNVGMGEPLVGIIGDFEAKKSKVKVYQANQHVGQQSVESVSYRLEDLKSGSVKIFRVLEL